MFKTHASIHCESITSALGPVLNAPTVSIDMTYICKLTSLPLNATYNPVEHSQMMDVDVFAVDENGNRY